MKNLNAVTFRNILAVLLIVAVGLIFGAFFFGYSNLKTVEEQTKAKQADATASNDNINRLQELEIELRKRSEVITNLESLRSSNSLPQFDTERSLRTIAGQLGLPVQNVQFINNVAPDNTQTSAQEPADNNEEGGQQPAAPSTPAAAKRSSRISFELGREVTYTELVTFLHALETSTPKITVFGISLPSGSSQGAVNPGAITIEVATQ